MQPLPRHSPVKSSGVTCIISGSISGIRISVSRYPAGYQIMMLYQTRAFLVLIMTWMVKEGKVFIMFYVYDRFKLAVIFC